MSLEKEIHDAGRASVILDDEVFKRAVAQIEESLLFGIRQSAFKDDVLREKLCHRFSLLHDLLQQLRSTMETGQLAQAEIERLTLAEKIKKAAEQFYL